MIPVTEQVNPCSKGIDTKPTLDILRIMNDQDKQVAFAVEKALPSIAPLVDRIVKAFHAGGRLVYIGAGTSGRLGVLDASECPPTFGVPRSLVVGIIAGGEQALRFSVENAEDDEQAGKEDLARIGLSHRDVVVGLTASGRAPYVVGALSYARSLHAATASIACNADAKTFTVSDFPLYVDVGPEIITGSTRLKSGTAEKMVLNMLTTTAMIRMGYVYDNYMVNLKASNSKLNERAKRLVRSISGCPEAETERAWDASGKSVPVAVLVARYGMDAASARKLLEASGGNLHTALETLGTQ